MVVSLHFSSFLSLPCSLCFPLLSMIFTLCLRSLLSNSALSASIRLVCLRATAGMFSCCDSLSHFSASSDRRWKPEKTLPQMYFSGNLKLNGRHFAVQFFVNDWFWKSYSLHILPAYFLQLCSFVWANSQKTLLKTTNHKGQFFKSFCILDCRGNRI